MIMATHSKVFQVPKQPDVFLLVRSQVSVRIHRTLQCKMFRENAFVYTANKHTGIRNIFFYPWVTKNGRGHRKESPREDGPQKRAVGQWRKSEWR